MIMKKLFSVFYLTLLSLPICADKVKIDGIWYELVPKVHVAEVIKEDNEEYSGDIVIPESVEFEGEKYNVSSIGNTAFSLCKDLMSVTIPNSVTTIKEWAFQGCTGLSSIRIPSSVSVIGNGAFWQCTGLSSVHISDLSAWSSIDFGGSHANPLVHAKHLFLNSEEIKDLIIPEGIEEIKDEAFAFCESFESLKIASTVKIVGKNAFADCTNLKIISIPNTVTTIRHQAFCGCSSLESIVLPESIDVIESKVFMLCEKLKSVTIPVGVNRIETEAFAGCKSLASIDIPSSVSEIQSCAFERCEAIKTITLPNSISVVSNYAFSDCKGLKTLILPNSVSKIEDYAFSYCVQLEDVYCYADNAPATKKDTFKDSYIDYATLHVPSSVVDAYKAADVWKDFKEIIALTDDDPKPTGIDKIVITDNNKGVFYDLNGRRVENPSKGIYISNGKKVIMK